MLYDSEKYVTNLSKVKETLRTYGVAIIPDVLSEEECLAARKGMWDTLGFLSEKWEKPIAEGNPGSWRGLKELYPKHSMLLQNWDVGHAQFIWDIRQNPRVVEVFSEIWGVDKEDLLVSFDGVSFHLPPETTNIGWYRATKYHTDQSPLNKAYDCVVLGKRLRH